VSDVPDEPRDHHSRKVALGAKVGDADIEELRKTGEIKFVMKSEAGREYEVKLFYDESDDDGGHRISTTLV
jgi:hypothetical protein